MIFLGRRENLYRILNITFAVLTRSLIISARKWQILPWDTLIFDTLQQINSFFVYGYTVVFNFLSKLAPLKVANAQLNARDPVKRHDLLINRKPMLAAAKHRKRCTRAANFVKAYTPNGHVNSLHVRGSK